MRVSQADDSNLQSTTGERDRQAADARLAEFARPSGEAEIDQFQAVGFLDEDQVPGLDLAVESAAFVGFR
jgi:hypothetical protein